MRDLAGWLRATARRLRDPAEPHDPGMLAAEMDRIAGRLEGGTLRVAVWCARVGLLAVAAALGMLVAGVWVDGRWFPTAGVTMMCALLLVGTGYAAGKVHDG